MLSFLAEHGTAELIIINLPKPEVLCHPAGWVWRLPLILTICLIVKSPTVTAESSSYLKFLRPNRADLLLDAILSCKPLQWCWNRALNWGGGTTHKQCSTLRGSFNLMKRLTPGYGTSGPTRIFELRDRKQLNLKLIRKGERFCPAFSHPLFFWVCWGIRSEFLSLSILKKFPWQQRF